MDVDLVLDRIITCHGVLIGNDGARTGEIAAPLGSCRLSSAVVTVLPLADAAQAHRVTEARHAGGKVVLAPRLIAERFRAAEDDMSTARCCTGGFVFDGTGTRPRRALRVRHGLIAEVGICLPADNEWLRNPAQSALGRSRT